MTTAAPTTEAYGQLQQAFDFFNERLFNNELPPVMFVIARSNRFAGYYINEQWESAAGKADEIAMNPTYMREVGIRRALSTLVHEMCHLQQYHFGTPSRGGYHNRQWGSMMEKVGLIPSHTGQPGGKRTGQKMTHCIADDDPGP